MQAVKRQPGNCTVFICFYVQRFLFISNKIIGKVQMEMCTDIAAVFYVLWNRKDIKCSYAGIQWFYAGKPCFLAGFTAGYLQKIAVAVGMTAGPGPGIVDVMIYEKSLVECFIEDKAGAGKVGHFIFT